MERALLPIYSVEKETVQADIAEQGVRLLIDFLIEHQRGKIRKQCWRQAAIEPIIGH